MEANKYYTPKVEEFHVGFEYEAKSNIGGNFFKTAFGDSNGEYTNELSDLYLDIKLNQIRVKYLDREDIESLGFKDSVFERQNFGFNDTTYFNIKNLGRENHYTIKYREENSWGGGEGILFQGQIKNKSELRKLMYQLNILKDDK